MPQTQKPTIRGEDFGRVFNLATGEQKCIFIYSDEEWDEVSSPSGGKKAFWQTSRNSRGKESVCLVTLLNVWRSGQKPVPNSWPSGSTEQLNAFCSRLPVDYVTWCCQNTPLTLCCLACSLLELHFASLHRSSAPYVPPTLRTKNCCFLQDIGLFKT